MATKFTAEQLKAMKAPDLRNAARQWGVSVGGKKPADIIREIQSKQQGGKTAATAASNTKVPGGAKATTGSLTAKPGAKPGVKPAAKPPPGRPPPPKAPTAVAAKPAAPKVPPKPAAPAKPAAPVAAKKPAPPAPPTGAKPASGDTEAKFRALIEERFKALIAPFSSALSKLTKEFNELKAAAMAAADEADAPVEEAPAEEAAEGEEGQEVEITQESLEQMDLAQLTEVAEQLQVEVKPKDTEKTLLARILKLLNEQGEVAEETVEADREETGNYDWIEEGIQCFVLMDNEWKEGAVSKINPKTNKITAFVYNPENPEEGWELEVGPDELAPIPTDDSDAGAEAAAADAEAAGEEIVEEAMEEEVAEEEVVEE